MIIPPPRPIEFRAYHAPTNTLFDVAFFTAEKIFESKWYIYYPREECVLMQFTGLYDCQGRKVFEGDVLWSHFHFGGKERDREYWRVIAYRAGGFYELARIDYVPHQLETEFLSNYSSAHESSTLEDRVVDCYYLRPDLLELNTESGHVPESFD